MSSITPSSIYSVLYDIYGAQGWWPVGDYGSGGGYHPGDFSVPVDDSERFEICTGAILTQNTAWKNVRLALASLQEAGALVPDAMLELSDSTLAELIRPAGYFNQKSRKLKIFSRFYRDVQQRDAIPSRSELLSLWGIGPETADCMLLYGWHQPEFVIDAYTVRCCGMLGIPGAQKGYDGLKRWFSDSYSEMRIEEKVKLFQEYHALFVIHGKNYYSRKPHGVNDPLLVGV